MTEYHNVDITIAAENGAQKPQIKGEIEALIDQAGENQEIDHCVMISKVQEVKE